MHTFNPSTLGAKVGRSLKASLVYRVSTRLPGLHSETLSKLSPHLPQKQIKDILVPKKKRTIVPLFIFPLNSSCLK